MRAYLVASRASTVENGLSDHGCGTVGYVGRALKAYVADSKGRGGEDARSVGSRRERLKRPLRLLFSYHYYKDEDLDVLLSTCFAGMTIDIFADSGAWSAWSIGQPIVEEAYVAWVERWEHLFTVVAGPDVIGDAAATKAATQRMIARVPGVPVLPTFHVREDWSYLRDYCAMSRYIALGGMVPYAKDRKLLRAWIAKAFEQMPEGQRVHGFGMTTWPLLCEFPWFSVDSSSWTSGFRYAQVMLFDEQRGRMQEINMRDSKALLQQSALLQSYGLRAGGMKASSYDRDLLCGALVESWQRAEAWLEKRRGGSVYLGLTDSFAKSHVEPALRGLLIGDGAETPTVDLGWGRRVTLTAEADGTRSYLVTGGASSSANSPAALAAGVSVHLALGNPKGETADPNMLGRSVGSKAYLACGSVAIPGAPNRPEGLQVAPAQPVGPQAYLACGSAAAGSSSGSSGRPEGISAAPARHSDK